MLAAEKKEGKGFIQKLKSAFRSGGITEFHSYSYVICWLKTLFHFNKWLCWGLKRHSCCYPGSFWNHSESSSTQNHSASDRLSAHHPYPSFSFCPWNMKKDHPYHRLWRQASAADLMLWSCLKEKRGEKQKWSHAAFEGLRQRATIFILHALTDLNI